MATIPKALRAEVRSRAKGRCEYCRSAEIFCGYQFEVDHIKPLAVGGKTILDNLALACSNCNGHKNARTAVLDTQTSEMTRVFDPRIDRWLDHFEWIETGLKIVGKTSVGRATVNALDMNNGAVVTARAFWISFGLHPLND